MPQGRGVTVVGSANLDVVVVVDRFPAPGETVLGGNVVEIAGGKGLNQAVAAGRSTPTALVACVGDDDAGRLLTTHLDRAGVHTRHVRAAAVPTGRAFIQVTGSGENSIVVAPGANQQLTPAEVTAALGDLRPAAVLAQLEVPLEAVEAAAAWAAEHGARFVLNPSPVRSLPPDLLRSCDPLVVNVTEAAQLIDAPEGTPVAELARALADLAASVVVTDGPRGALAASASGVHHVAGPPVEAVDTTGAGDEFTGRLVASLLRGETMVQAVHSANLAAAGLVTQPRGTR